MVVSLNPLSTFPLTLAAARAGLSAAGDEVHALAQLEQRRCRVGTCRHGAWDRPDAQLLILQQGGDEGHIAAHAVQLGDQQLCAGPIGQSECLKKQ